ncbi:TPA: PTS fructose transporter subunit IIC [Streptococcus agalactiae]
MKDMIKKANFKGHLLTAISYLIPIVCGAGFLVAIGMAMGGRAQDALVIGNFSFWDTMATMGGKALGLLPVIIATGIAFSIAGKPGIAPGFVVGLIANAISAGFIGVLSGVDLGGPLNKTVYAFVLTLQAEGVKEPLTALQLVNTATPVGFGLAYFIAKLFKKNIYTNDEIETLKSAVPMGIVNIVEGVIPIVMNNLMPAILAIGVGGAVGGAVSMTMGADSAVPFGGILMIPTMTRPIAGICGLLSNILVTGLVYSLAKKPVDRNEVTIVSAEDEEDIALDDIEIM